MVNVRKLNKLTKEELIDEIRNRDFIISNLMKESKNQSVTWRNYYRSKDWKNNK